MSTHCFYTEIARRKLSAPPEWIWCKLQAIGPDATLVEGGVPRTLKTGKNKGKLTWHGVDRATCIVTHAELDAEHAAYEQTTGRCYRCLGEGKSVSASAAGVTYGECSRCRGTGNKP